MLTRAFDSVVVTDIRMPDMDGLQLFQRLRDLDAEIPVILITGHGDIATAVQCMREGAYDFLAKPYPAERLIATIGHAAEKRRLVLENRRLREAAFASGADAEPFIGNTPAMLRIKRRCGISPTPTWTCWWKARPAPASGRQRTASYEPPTPARTGGDQLRRAARKRDRERAVRP